MTHQDLEQRRRIWLALSELYLDTELDAHDFSHVARVSKSSGFSLAEARRIDAYEVAPLVGRNLWVPAGVWSGFDTSWLYQNCEINFNKRKSIVHRLKCFMVHVLLLRTRKRHWDQISMFWYQQG